MIGIPVSLEGVVMYRNAAIISEASREFVALIASSRRSTRGKNVGVYIDRGGIFGVAQITACGGTILDDDGYPNFSNAAGLCWLDLLKSFEDVGPVTFDTNDDFTRFAAGDIGIIFDGTWNLKTLSDTLGEDLVIDPWPKYRDEHLSGFVWADCVYMHPHLPGNGEESAWVFVEFLLGESAQSILADFGLIPSILDVQVSDLNIHQAIRALSQGTSYPAMPQVNYIWDPLNSAMKSVLEEDADPALALQSASDQVLAEISEQH